VQCQFIFDLQVTYLREHAEGVTPQLINASTAVVNKMNSLDPKHPANVAARQQQGAPQPQQPQGAPPPQQPQGALPP
jgi:hypothetical protein